MISYSQQQVQESTMEQQNLDNSTNSEEPYDSTLIHINTHFNTYPPISNDSIRHDPKLNMSRAIEVVWYMQCFRWAQKDEYGFTFRSDATDAWLLVGSDSEAQPARNSHFFFTQKVCLPSLFNPTVPNEKATRHSDGAYTVRLSVGGRTHFFYPAILFSDAFSRNETLNETMRTAEQSSWTCERHGGRPEILYKYQNDSPTPLPRRVSHFQPWFHGDGRIIINSDLAPMRFIPGFPDYISTAIQGWELEAIMREDARVMYQDITDRMPSTEGAEIRPSLSTLKRRRGRARHEMRITGWGRKTTDNSFWQDIIEYDLTDQDRRNNSTKNLVDFTPMQVAFLEDLRALLDEWPEAKKKERILPLLQDRLQSILDLRQNEGHGLVLRVKEKIRQWEQA